MNLINIIPYLIVIFIGNILYSICFGKLINQKFKFNLRNIFLTFIYASILCIINSLPNLTVQIILRLVVGTIYYYLIFSQSLKKTIIGFIFIYSITILTELFYTNLYGYLKIITDNASVDSLNIIRLSISIFVCSTVFVLFFIPLLQKIFIKIFKLLIKSATLTNVVYIMFIVSGILGLTNVENFYQHNSIYLLISLIIIFAILFTIIVKVTTHRDYLKESNQKLTAYNDSYNKFLKDYKIYMHNIKHKLKSVKNYGDEKVNELIDDILEEKTSFDIKNNDMYNLPNGIKATVAERLYNTKLDVLIDNKIKGDPFKNLSARSFNETSTCLGIVLDNAVEASELVKNPVIVLDLKEDKNNIYIKIGNKFKNNIDLAALGSFNYSTKNRGSGFGLFSIIRSKKIKEQISIINDIFYIELKITK